MVWSQFRVWDLSQGPSLRSAVLQSFNSSTSLPLLLQESLYLSLSSTPGWFSRVTWAVSCTKASPEFLTACCLNYKTESKSLIKIDVESREETGREGEGKSRPHGVNEFILTTDIYSTEFTFLVPWLHVMHVPQWTMQRQAFLPLKNIYCFMPHNKTLI